MSENKYFDEIKNLKMDKNKNVIKVNTKKVKQSSHREPREDNKLIHKSKSNSKSKINFNKTGNNKSKLFNAKSLKKAK